MSNNSIIKDREMDIFHLFETLWKDKKIILFFIVLTTIICLSYIFIEKKEITYTGEVKITSLNDTDLAPLKLLENNLRKLEKIDVNISEDLYARSIIINSTPVNETGTILAKDAKQIFDLFYQKLFSFNVALRSAKKIYSSDNDNSDDFYKIKANSISANTKKMINVIDRIGTGNFYMQISYTNKNKKLVEETLVELINFASISVQNQLLETINLNINNYERRIQYEIKRLQDDNKLLLENYKITIEDELIFLKEQAKIARSIGIDKPQVPQIQQSTQTIQTTSTARVSAGSLMPEYYQGFVVLENKIDILENRENHQAFIPQYRFNELAIKKLENDKKTESLKKSIVDSGLIDLKFYPVKYDFESMSISKNQDNNSILILISAIFGLILGSFIVIIRAFYLRYKSNI